MSTSSIRYHSQDPWPSPYDMRASYYVCYTRGLGRSSVSLDHPSSPWTGPEPQKLLSQTLLETDSSGLFPRRSASSFTRGLSLQLIFLSAAILEEKKTCLENGLLFLSLRDASLVHAVSRGRQAPSPLLVALSDLALGWVGLYAGISGLLIVPQDLPFPSPQQA